MHTRSAQVLVVGGGPAGSTTATFIARQGYQVVLAERATFPRYHIGESLLPSCLRIFDLLGVRQKIEAHGFVRKDGAHFEWSGEPWDIEFSNLAQSLYGFQVIRSQFDKLLLEHARSEGVEVMEAVEVKEINFDNGRPVTATLVDSNGVSGRISFDILADASGRAGLMSTRYLHNRSFHDAFMNLALWGYWKNARRLSIGPAGAIATCSIPVGWIWAIPLHDETLSVGLVLHKSKFKELRQYFTLEEIYRNAIASSQLVTSLVESGDLASPLRIESDYSYAAERFAGPSYYLIGDAACFLDPLLSTGVHLATFSGLVAGASIVSTLNREVREVEAAQFYDVCYHRAYLRMLVVVAAFYQTHREKDTHFRHAQRLTSRDYRGSELIQAFLHIVSGIEDLADVEDVQPQQLLDMLLLLYEEHYAFARLKGKWETLTLDEVNKGIARTRLVNAIQEDFSLTPETAVNGLYVATDPRLGLRRAPG